MTDRRLFTRKLDIARGAVDMTHGSGGKAMAQLVRELFAAAFANPYLDQGNDQAAFDVPGGRMVMTTDGFVVSPLFFPGGDIGSLAVHGTVNDVAMAGAVPLHLTAGFIIEEGFPLADLKRVVDSMAAAAREAGVAIVSGDTKVVERGKGDGIFITTTGIGMVPPGVAPSGDRARPGDAILVSGTMGDHGVAIMSTRDNLGFETAILSDSAGSYVYIVGEDNKVERRDVKTGGITDDGIIVTEGLTGKERVIARAGAFVSTGETVKPRMAKPQG